VAVHAADPGEAEQLIAAAAQMSISLDATQAAQLLTLLDLLTEWNGRINLTAIRERGEMILKHLLDSLSVQPWIAGPVVIDVGTGAGFPGLPLAVINPGIRFVLLDSTAKKLAFVSHAAEVLGLANVEVVHARAESYEPSSRAATVVTRAFGALPLIVAQAGALCARSGRLLAMKGRVPTEEMDKLPHAWVASAVERLAVPGLDQERHLVILERRH
jgi:16S rRNA (guanine527-N7)-methyltransferase